MTTKIEWTNFLDGYKGETWNIVTGCEDASEGCRLCYAKAMSHRLAGIRHSAAKYAGTTKKSLGGKIQWTGLVKTHTELLTKPQDWKSPKVVFVCSMSDLFHKDVDFGFINAAYQVMADHPQHLFLLLSKRPDRMLEFQQWKSKRLGAPWFPPKNVWHGTSVENQKQAEIRIPLLMQVRGTVRYLSCEPLIESVDISKWLSPCSIYCDHSDKAFDQWVTAMEEQGYPDEAINDEAPFFYSKNHRPNQQAINWVIAGGESGHTAQPMHPDWLRSLRDQCQEAQVPFFFKQWGEYGPFMGSLEGLKPYNDKSGLTFTNNNGDLFNLFGSDGLYCSAGYDKRIDLPMQKIGKKHSGRELDGREWNEYPLS